jgi:hypothetical protein
MMHGQKTIKLKLVFIRNVLQPVEVLSSIEYKRRIEDQLHLNELQS